MRIREVVATFAALPFMITSAAFATPFLVTPFAFDFGDVATGDTANPQTVTITNVTGTTQSLSLAGGAAGVFGGATNCGTTLAAGASCEIFYAFTPTDLGAATRSATLSVNGESISFSFEGTGLNPFLVTPRAFDFGHVATGDTSSSQTVTITNVSGSTQSLSLAGGAAGEFGGATNCGSSLAAGASCQIFYAFTPSTTGSATRVASLSVNGETTTFSFTGTGGTDDASPFVISPRSLSFGNIPTGETSTPQTVTITNVTGTTQSLSLAGGAAGVFGGATNCGTTLAAGASCEIFYAFTPTDLGAATRSTTLSVNGESISFSFEGTGLNPFLVTPLGLDFGEIALGDTSLVQTIDIFNVSDDMQALSLAGGAAGVFGGATNCGTILAAGAFCQIFYAFTPTALGVADRTATLSINGMPSTFSFRGIGIGPNDGSDTGYQVAVSEPGALGMLAAGLILFAAFRRRKPAT